MGFWVARKDHSSPTSDVTAAAKRTRQKREIYQNYLLTRHLRNVNKCNKEGRFIYIKRIHYSSLFFIEIYCYEAMIVDSINFTLLHIFLRNAI